MKYRLIFIVCISSIVLCCCKNSDKGEYFVRPCEFVCDYPFNDTTKWAITCRVWGLLKYYHPNVTAGKLDWDKALFDRVVSIDASSTPESVNEELRKMLDFAGEYEYKKGDLDNSLKMNLDLCWIDGSFLEEDLRKELKKIASMKVDFPAYYSIDYANTSITNEKYYEDIDLSTSSYKYRLLSLFRYWNVIYYFFPHKYLMDQSWDITLNEYIFPFKNSTDSISLKKTFLKFATMLNDGHGFTSFADSPPLESYDIIEIVNGKTVVRIDAGGLQKGDIIEYVGERKIGQIRDSLSVFIPASTQWNKEYRINCDVAELVFLKETDVIILRNGQNVKVHMQPVTFDNTRSASYKRISEKIGYVNNLLGMTTEEMEAMFQSFSDAAFIIFDLRNTKYTTFNPHLFYCHLIDNKYTRLNSMVIPHSEHPGAFVMLKDHKVLNNDSIKCPHYKGKVVYLINEFSQSRDETIAWVGRTNFNAILIGRTTSGALESVRWTPLPGGHWATFSAAGAFSLDGTEYQRKGVTPDIEVYPTMESIKAGKDEILEAAIEYITNH
jgi:Periplasmic protease